MLAGWSNVAAGLGADPLSHAALLLGARSRRYALGLALGALAAVVCLRALLQNVWLYEILPPGVHLWADQLFSTASAYYAEQRPIFAAVADGYELYWPFAQTTGIDSLDLTSAQIVQQRLLSWGRQYQKLGRTDFKVEKDKCEMYRFLQRGGLPHERILRNWNSTEGVISDVESMALFDSVTEWPIFLKACHLTQATSASVLRMPSRNWVAEHKEMIAEWVKAKWVYRSDDFNMRWREEGNALTDVLVPGFFLQAPAQFTYDAGFGGWTPWEMKVDVIWGRAYTGVLYNGGQDTGFFTRSPGGGFEWHRAEGIGSLAFLGRLVPRSLLPTHVQKILAGGHLGICIFPLAERLAQTLRIDHIRVDIFIRGDDPARCAVNEISLSSGLPMFSHKNYVAKLWAQPFVDRTFAAFGNETSKPAYMRTPDDFPGTPRQVLGLPAARPSSWVFFWQAAALALAGAVAACAWLLGCCGHRDKKSAS